jgi:hypothetical protein
MKFIKLSGAQLLLLFSFSFFAACNGKPSDTEMQQSIIKQLSGNENYKEVAISVKDGAVTLNGNCAGENCVTEIGKIVKENKYVSSVINNIQEKSTIPAVSLNTSLQRIISHYPGIQGEISNSIITLKGSITRENLPLLMKEISALHPRKVDDQIAVTVK